MASKMSIHYSSHQPPPSTWLKSFCHWSSLTHRISMYTTFEENLQWKVSEKWVTPCKHWLIWKQLEPSFWPGLGISHPLGLLLLSIGKGWRVWSENQEQGLQESRAGKFLSCSIDFIAGAQNPDFLEGCPD